MTTPSSSPDGDYYAQMAAMERDAAAMDPPVFRRGGRLVRGRILSFPEWQRFEPRLARLLDGKLSDHQARAFVYEYVSAVFPPARWPRQLTSAVAFLAGAAVWWAAGLVWSVVASLAVQAAGLALRRRSVAWQVLRLPEPLQVKALMDFLAFQTPANAVYLGRNPTSGSSSRHVDDGGPPASQQAA